MAYPKDIFLESLNRCREAGDFTAAFYENLLNTDEEIRHRFRLTDMERQREKLNKSLDLCAAATAGDPDGLAELRELGKLHSRLRLDIHPEWYPLWIEAIVATASQFDPEWDEEVDASWRRVLGLVTERIASFYDD